MPEPVTPREDGIGRVTRYARAFVPAALRAPLQRLYAHLPYAWRQSPTFRSTLHFLRTSEGWDAEQFAPYQMQRLGELLQHAQANVPGYRQKFAAHGVDPHSIKSLQDLRRLPYLTKEDLRADPERFVAQNIPRESLQFVFSGGTTGTPTGFYHIARYNDDVAKAFRLEMWRRIGYVPRTPILDLTCSFPGGPLSRGPSEKILWLSIAALDPHAFPAYADAVLRFQPAFLLGFPSTVTLFAQLLSDSGLPRPRLRGIITASEVMHEAQRRYISECFGCRILEWYGMAEYAGFAAGCESSDAYHFFPQAGCVELVDDQDLPVTREGAEGEIVLTGFYNWATPFIRYRTGDRATLGERRCPACGRHYPLVARIIGRRQEYLVGRTGRLVPHSALNVHSDLFDKVWTYQFRQDTPGEVCLSIVRKASYRPERTEAIRSQVRGQLGPDVILRIEFVDEIPRTGRGKHQFIVQRLPISQLEAAAPAARS